MDGVDWDGILQTSPLFFSSTDKLVLGLTHQDGTFGLTRLLLGNLEPEYFLVSSMHGALPIIHEDGGKIFGVGYLFDANSYYTVLVRVK